MSKYNESSTKWKLDSWHSIVLQIFILVLIGGLTIFVYDRYFVGELVIQTPAGPKIKELKAQISEFSRQIVELQEKIKESEKTVIAVLGGGDKDGQVPLDQAAESFDTMLVLLGSIIDEDQNATFKDAQAAYDNLEGALKELKNSELGDLKSTIWVAKNNVRTQEGEVKKLQTQIESREKDIEKFNYWKDLAATSTKAAEKKHAEKQAEDLYKVAVYAESILEELNADLKKADTELTKLLDTVKQGEADKKMLDTKVAGYNDDLKKFDERMEAWKGLVKDNNEETDELIENGEKLVELQGILSGTNMIAVVEDYTEKRLKDAIKEKDDFIVFAETEIKRKTKAIAVSEESLKNLIKLYGNIGIIIPADPDSSLPPLPDGIVPPGPTNEVDPSTGLPTPLPGLPGATPILPATGNVPIDPSTGLPTPTGLGGIPVIPTGGAVGVGDTAAEKAKASVEKTRAEIKKRRSEVEQLKEDKLEAEGSLKKLKEDIATFKAAQKARVEEFSKAGSRMAELKSAETQLEEYKRKINETDWADAVAEYHKANEAVLLDELKSRKERQTNNHTFALNQIELLKDQLKTAIKDVNSAEKKLIKALKARKDEELVEDLQEDLTKKEEDVEVIEEDLANQEKDRDDASEAIEKLGAQITGSEARLNGFIVDSDNKDAKDAAKTKKAKKLGDVYDMLYGEDWEQAAINFIRRNEEDRTNQFKERKDESKSAVDDANKIVADLKEKDTTLKGQLAIWEGILEGADRITKKTAESQVRKNTRKINANDLALLDAIENVETSDGNYHFELKNYQNRLQDVREIIAELDAREVALNERRNKLNLAGAHSRLAGMFFKIGSSREIGSYDSELRKIIAALQVEETKLSNKVDSLKKSVAEKEGELRLKKEELEVVTEKFDADPDTYLPGETIKSVGEQLKNLQKEVRTISGQIEDDQGDLNTDKRNYDDAKSQRASAKQALDLVINRNKPIPTPTEDPTLRVAFKPYFTDPKGNDHSYDVAVHRVIKKPQDKEEADKLFEEQKAVVEGLVDDFNAFSELREGKSGQAKKNYTTLMDDIWAHVKGKYSSDLDVEGQFHHKVMNFTPTKDGETLFVFCIGRKDDRVRFGVKKVTFYKSGKKELQRIQLSSAN